MSNDITKDESVGLFSYAKGMIIFLMASLLMTVSIALILSFSIHEYFSLSPEIMLVILCFATIYFFVVNFRVVRGSFRAVKILKYTLYILIVFFLPSMFMRSFEITSIVVNFICLTFPILSILIIQSSIYLAFVKKQHDAVQDWKNIQAEADIVVAQQRKSAEVIDASKDSIN